MAGMEADLQKRRQACSFAGRCSIDVGENPDAFYKDNCKKTAKNKFILHGVAFTQSGRFKTGVLYSRQMGSHASDITSEFVKLGNLRYWLVIAG